MIIVLTMLKSVSENNGNSGYEVLHIGLSTLPYWQLIYAIPLSFIAFQNEGIGVGVGIVANSLFVAWLISSYLN